MATTNFSNRWREGAEQILSEKKAKSSSPAPVLKRAKKNPTKEEYKKRAIDTTKFIAEMTPIIGDAIAVKEVYDEITKPNPNWFLVGALGTGAVIGLIPGLGDAAAKLIKKGAERALDVSSRIEINLNTLGSTGGNIKIKPKDLADVQAKKIQKILKKEKNVNDNFYMLHGGADFDKMDLKASGLGEPGSFRPLGRGIYGSRIVDPKNIETIKNAYLQASQFAGHFGTSATRNYAGFSHPLYKQAFKDANIPIETTESLLKELQKKVPIEVTTEQVGKIHLFKVPRTKELKVYDFKNRKGIAQNTENVKTTYPREFSSRFTIASPKFGDSQVVLQPLGEVEEMAIHDPSVVERLIKLDLPEEFFENINKRKLRKNELDPNYPQKYIVNDKLNNLEKEAQYITDRENLDPKTMEINLLKDLQNKGYIDKSVNIDELPDVKKEKLFNYPETVENFNQEDFLKEMQEDIEVSRRNVFVPEDRLELGEDSTQSLGLDSGKRIPKRTVEYNKGGMSLNNQTEDIFGDQIFDPTTGLRKDIPSINESDIISIPQQPLPVRDPVFSNVSIPKTLETTIQDTLRNVETSPTTMDADFDLNVSTTTLPTQTNLDEPKPTDKPYLQKDPRELIWQRRDLIPKVFKTAIDLEHLIRLETDTGFRFDSGLRENDTQQAVAISGIIANALSGKDIEAYANNPSAIDPKKVWWCASYVHELLFKSHLPTVTRKRIPSRDRGTKSGTAAPARADQYKYHGEEVKGGITNARSGDIIVIDRNGNGTGQHAAILVGDEISFGKPVAPDGYIYVLGGNQDNKVSVKLERKDQILAVRRVTPDTIENTLDLLKTDTDESSPINLLTKTHDNTSLDKLQQQINLALKESGGKFTKEINNLVKQRTKLREQKNNFNKGGTPMNNNYRIEPVSQIEDMTSFRRKFNRGGMLQEGGMQDDGMDRDPVSGNEVPPGSLAKEVRDDIPAQLSEGEYVVPADVVQYYGLKFFEELRDKAKMELAKMERNGRIGGEPMGQSMPNAPQQGEEDFPFSADELQTFNAGGTPRGYQPGGGVSYVGTPQMVTQASPLTYVSPVVATPQVNQPTMGTGVSGNVYTSGIQPSVNMATSMPMNNVKMGTFVNEKCVERSLPVDDNGYPLFGTVPGFVSSTSPEGIEFSKVCFPDRFPDDDGGGDVGNGGEETPTDNLEATQPKDEPGYESEAKKSYEKKSTDVFFKGPDGKNHVATIGGRDGYAGDQSGPAKEWAFEDYAEYLNQLDSGVGKIFNSIPIVQMGVQARHKEILQNAKKQLESGLNNYGDPLTFADVRVLEGVLLHEELGGLFDASVIGNVKRLLGVDSETPRMVQGKEYKITYEPDHAMADEQGYVRFVDGEAIDPSRYQSLLGGQLIEIKNADGTGTGRYKMGERALWNNGATYSSSEKRRFLATGVARITDPSGNEHIAQLVGDYYIVGGQHTHISEILEDVGDPELAKHLADNPALILGWLPKTIRGKYTDDPDTSISPDDFGIKTPGSSNDPWLNPDPDPSPFTGTDPFTGTGNYEPFGATLGKPVSRPDIITTGTETSSVGSDITTTGTETAVLGDTTVSPTLASVNSTVNQFSDDSVGEGFTTGSDTPSGVSGDDPYDDDDDDWGAPAYVSNIPSGVSGDDPYEDDDDDDDDAISAGQQQGKGYVGGFGFRRGGTPKKQTIQKERVKV